MSPLLIWCRLCDVGYASVGEIPSMCPNCLRPTVWTTFGPQAAVDLRLTVQDRTFLQQLHIQADEP